MERHQAGSNMAVTHGSSASAMGSFNRPCCALCQSTSQKCFAAWQYLPIFHTSARMYCCSRVADGSPPLSHDLKRPLLKTVGHVSSI
eukprot:357733-Pelagomonas_calceolata.AAC.12